MYVPCMLKNYPTTIGLRKVKTFEYKSVHEYLVFDYSNDD